MSSDRAAWPRPNATISGFFLFAARRPGQYHGDDFWLEDQVRKLAGAVGGERPSGERRAGSNSDMFWSCPA